MSWAIDFTGTKSDVAKKVTEELDKVATRYEGKEEAKDVLAAKERILAIVQAVALTKEPSELPGWNAVSVRAAGSHSLTENGIAEAKMTFTISRKHVD